MTSPSPAPTIPPDFLPTQQGCLASTDYWIWDFQNTKDERTVIGGPSQTISCLPSTWNPESAYVATQCPPQYTAACQNPSGDEAVTCCPTIYNFKCADNIASSFHGHYFRCVSQWGASQTGSIKVTRTDLIANTLNVGTRPIKPSVHLFALALVYTTPTSTSPPGSTSDPTSSPSPALGGGAIAGIVVGAIAAVALLFVLAWLLYRRKATRANSAAGPSDFRTPAAKTPAGGPGTSPAYSGYGESYAPEGGALKSPRYAQESSSLLPDAGSRSELPGSPRRSELQGSPVHPSELQG